MSLPENGATGVPAIKATYIESFGYDCLHRKNLQILPASGKYPATLAIISGTSIVFRGVEDGQIVRDSLRTSGIGSMAIHPKGHVFAVGEKSNTTGVKPKISLYSWPEVELIGELEGASERCVTYLTFSPLNSTYSTELLASIGGSPDFLLTLWNWKESKIVLRNKAYGQDIYRVAFNPTINGQLCSSGIGHIKFWTMASTFTGLKLQGELGRFGKTTISDVESFVMLQDGRVLSGSEWGNILLWDGGLISIEVCRSDGSTCHDGPIRCMSLDESGELLTTGADGAIRVWNAEAILDIDAGEVEDGMFKFDVMNELKIPSKVTSDIVSLVRYHTTPAESATVDDDAEEENMWLAQDSKGAIWTLDLSFSHRAKQPRRILSSHGGQINDLVINETSELVASVGDSFVRIYKLQLGTGVNDATDMICKTQVISPANGILWRGRRHLLVGHDDGVVRLYGYMTHGAGKKLVVQQAVKPHTSEIISIQATPDQKYIISASKDGTVFFYKCGGAEDNWLITPIGFVAISGYATAISVSPESFQVFVGTSDSNFYSFDMTSLLEMDLSLERNTYALNIAPRNTFTFASCKDQLKRDSVRKNAEDIRQKEIKRKQTQLKAKKDNGEEFTADQEAEFLSVPVVEIDDSPLYIPEVPGKIMTCWSVNSDDSEFVITLSGYDAGFLYQVNAKTGRVINAVDIETNAGISYVHREASGFVYLGFTNGQVRMYQGEGLMLLPEEFDQTAGQFQQHDIDYGQIAKIATFGTNQLITAGLDGNVFRFTISGCSARAIKVARPVSVRQFFPVKDIDNRDAWSLEQSREKEEEARRVKQGEKRKELRLEKLKTLQSEFEKLTSQNHKLPNLAQVGDIVSADNIASENDDSAKKSLEQQLNVVRQTLLPTCIEVEVDAQKKEQYHLLPLVFDGVKVSNFEQSQCVQNYKLKELFTKEFRNEYDQIRNSLRSRQSTNYENSDDGSDESGGEDRPETAGRPTSSQSVKRARRKSRRNESIRATVAEMTKMSKEEQVRYEKALRKEEWAQLELEKPDMNRTDPRDEEEIAEARRLLGDLKLKTSDDYVVPEEQRANADQKRLTLMDQEKEIYKRQYQFDIYVNKLVQKKRDIIDFIATSVARLKSIQTVIPEDQRLQLPTVPCLEKLEVPALRYAPQAVRVRDHLERVSNEGRISTKFPSLLETTSAPANVSAAASLLIESHDYGDLFPRAAGPETPAEESWVGHRTVDLISEQRSLLEQIDAKKTYFNGQIKTANLLRSIVDVHLGAGKLTADTLLQESWLLEQFESREKTLEERVQTRMKDLGDAKRNRVDAENKFKEKQEMTKELQRDLKVMDEDFISLMPDNAKAADWLTRVFRKKIKRKKDKEQKESKDGASDESDSESDSDSDFSEDESMGSEGGSVFDEKAQPVSVSDDVLARCLEMREARLDIEEDLAEMKKQSDQVRKETDAFLKKVKSFDSQLALAKKDSEVLQQEKQKALNQLWVTVPMFYKNINQKLIQTPVKTKAQRPEYREELPKPKQLNECLVLPANTMERLKSRIKDLEDEQRAQQKLRDAARQQRVALARQKGEKEQRCKELEEQANQLMELRFGRVLDIDSLQQASGVSSRGIDELYKRIRDVEQRISQDYKVWSGKIAQQTEELTNVTQANTDLLRELDELNEEQNRLAVELEHRQRGESKPSKQLKHPDDYMTGSGDVRLGREQQDETKQLDLLIRVQTEKMNALTAEIEQLSRKGGAVAPPK